MSREVLRWARLMAGLFVFGFVVSLMIRSGLGLGPWDAFHVGLHKLTGISIGGVSILVGVVILCGTMIMGERPGLGTVVNMVMIGIFIDVVLPMVPEASGWIQGLGYYAVAIGLAGLGTGMYISAGMGKGPRDGLAILLGHRWNWPVRRVRLLIEVIVLIAGWAMGGMVGVGTILFALLIGPAMQWGLQLFRVPSSARVSSLPADPASERPRPRRRAA